MQAAKAFVGVRKKDKGRGEEGKRKIGKKGGDRKRRKEMEG